MASPISAPICAYGLPGRKKGNQISLVAFMKPGGADGSARCFYLSLKSAVTCHFYAEKCLIRHGYPVAIIPPILRSEYITLLEIAHRTPEKFIDFIVDRETDTLRELLRLLGDDVAAAAETPLPSDCEKLLQILKNDPGLRVPELMKQMQKSRPTVERYLRQLREKELIEFRGAPKNGGYFTK